MPQSPESQSSEPSGTHPIQPIGLAQRPSVVFLYSGLLFLFAALGLFALLGSNLYRISEMGPIIEVPGSRGIGEAAPATMTDRDIYNFYGRIFSFLLAPLFMGISAAICTFVGIRLLRAAGAVFQWETADTRAGCGSTAVGESMSGTAVQGLLSSVRRAKLKQKQNGIP